jgi:hypothetical protein
MGKDLSKVIRTVIEYYFTMAGTVTCSLRTATRPIVQRFQTLKNQTSIQSTSSRFISRDLYQNCRYASQRYPVLHITRTVTFTSPCIVIQLRKKPTRCNYTGYFIIPSQNVGPCQHGMARPQVADRGTASNMEGSCE